MEVPRYFYPVHQSSQILRQLTKRDKDWSSFLSENRRKPTSGSGKKKGNQHRYGYAIPYEKLGGRAYYRYEELEKFAKHYTKLATSWR